MSDFIPPYPPRLASQPSAWRRLMLGRQSFIAMWEEGAFEVEFGSARMFMRQTFLCNSPDSVQFALSLKSTSFERKSPPMRHALEPLLGDGLFVSDGAIWRQRRPIVAPIVHTSRLPEFAPIIVEAAGEVQARWKKLDGATIDILSQSAQLTAEIICRSIFGRKLGSDHAQQVVEGFSEYQHRIGQIDPLSFLGLPDWVPRWQPPGIHKTVTRIHDVLDGIIESYRQESGTREPSVVGRLLDARDETTGQPLSREAIRNEVAVLFMAGHETTANALAWTWYLLSQSPDVEARLHQELDSVLDGRLPGLGDVQKLIYTRAIFEEALRLYPPVPILAREATRDENFQGNDIPKGSLVSIVPWLLHRHKKLWDQPDHFIPERFLPENADKISKFAYIPFSVGPRVCAGLAFGLTEAILCLAILAQSFKLRLQPGYDVKPVCRLTLRPDGGIPMIIESRDTLLKTALPPIATVGCPVPHG